MPHIHTGEGEHDFTVSGFIVRTDGAESRLLLHQHKLLGRWLQFGGHIELDEHLWSALAHELQEESGYNLSQLTLLQQDVDQPEYEDYETVTAHPQPAHLNTHDFDNRGHHFHTDLEYVFITDEEPESTVEDNESGTLRLFTEDELKALPEEEIPRNVKAIGLFALKICQSDKWRHVAATDFNY